MCCGDEVAVLVRTGDEDSAILKNCVSMCGLFECDFDAWVLSARMKITDSGPCAGDPREGGEHSEESRCQVDVNGRLGEGWAP